MSQRQKARDFVKREGHGAAAADMTVSMGDKNRLGSDLRTASPIAAKANQVYEKGATHPVDGLLRGHCKSA